MVTKIGTYAIKFEIEHKNKRMENRNTYQSDSKLFDSFLH